MSSKHLNGKIDKLFHYEINDELDCISIESLIKSNFCESRPTLLNKSYNLEFFKNKSKPKLLFTAPYEFFDDFFINHIIYNYDVVFAYNAPLSVVKDLIKDREIIFTSTCPNYLLDNSILENSKIKVIATPSTGTNHIAENILINNKFQIISIKESKVIEDIYASSEFSFTLLLALVKKLSITCDNSKYGIWRENETQMRSNELYGKK